MGARICLVGALDTKGEEYAFVKARLVDAGCTVLVVDVGVLGEPAFAPEVSRARVCAAGGAELDALRGRSDRGEAVAAMSRGLAALLPALHREGAFDAVLAMGGTGGTSVACTGMRALPLGVPKVMVSTVAGSDVSAYVGVSDIVMIPSIVDVAGINAISREVFTRAAAAVAAMAGAQVPAGVDKPLIAASMFGNTTKAVGVARAIFEAAGYEVLVFHCTGNGGRTLEALAAAGRLAGVFDITTTEWADELVGGVFRAGPDRLLGAARSATPAIVAPGCLDMVNFGAPSTVPTQFAGRTFYPHNPNVTLMRTTVEECRELGAILAARLNESKGPVTVLLPQRGWSMIDAPGGPFWLPEANAAFDVALKAHLRRDIEVREFDANVNDESFARACAEALLANIAAAQSTTR